MIEHDILLTPPMTVEIYPLVHLRLSRLLGEAMAIQGVPFFPGETSEL